MTSREALELLTNCGTNIEDSDLENKVMDIFEKLVDQENENLMLKNKISMYKELVEKQNSLLEECNDWDIDPKVQEERLEEIEDLLKQISTLDKKCDGACEI